VRLAAFVDARLSAVAASQVAVDFGIVKDAYTFQLLEPFAGDAVHRAGETDDSGFRLDRDGTRRLSGYAGQTATPPRRGRRTHACPMRDGRGLLNPSLLYFAETARCGSIRQAADRLHVAPSAISRQILLLEHELGAPLLTRSRRGVVPTEQGQLVCHFVESAGRDLERLRSAVDDLNELRCGRVFVAAVEAATGRVLPACFAAFQGAHPGVSIQVRIAGTHQVAEAVLREEAHIGVALDPPYRSELLLRMRWPQPLQAVVCPDHPLAAKAGLSIAAVLAVPHSLPDRSFGIRTLIEKAAALADATPMPLVETNSLDMAKCLAIAGHSATVLPPEVIVRELASGQLRAIPLLDAPLARASIDVFIARGRVLPRAAEVLLAALKRAMAGHRL